MSSLHHTHLNGHGARPDRPELCELCALHSFSRVSLNRDRMAGFAAGQIATETTRDDAIYRLTDIHGGTSVIGPRGGDIVRYGTEGAGLTPVKLRQWLIGTKILDRHQDRFHLRLCVRAAHFQGRNIKPLMSGRGPFVEEDKAHFVSIQISAIRAIEVRTVERPRARVTLVRGALRQGHFMRRPPVGFAGAG